MKRHSSKYTQLRFRQSHWLAGFLVASIMVLALVSIWENKFVCDQETLCVWFFDVGQGDGIFIKTPSGKKIIVDAGPDASILTKLGEVMWPWDKTIDAIVMTHPDADHISGFIPILKRYRVGRVFETGVVADTQIDTELRNIIQTERIPITRVRRGDILPFSDVSLAVMWPSDEVVSRAEEGRNNTSVVIKLMYGETTVLLTGDAEEISEKQFAGALGHIDVLKVGHHGSVSSTSPFLLQSIHSNFAVFSVGANNRYGHPHPLILDRLQAISAKIFRTDIDGDILLRSHGGEPMVESHPLLF